MIKLKQKLIQNKGETLSEVLVGLLIACIATAMFAAMLQSSSKIMKASGEALQAYYSANDSLAARDTSSPASQTVTLKQLTVSGNGSPVSKPADIQLRPGESSVTVSYYVNSEASKVPVASYKISGTQTGGDGE